MNILDPSVPSEEIVTTKLKGFSLRLSYPPTTYLGRFLYWRGMCEEGVIKKLTELLKPSMVFVDVGANISLYSVIAANIAGRCGCVIASEP